MDILPVEYRVEEALLQARDETTSRQVRRRAARTFVKLAPGAEFAAAMKRRRRREEMLKATEAEIFDEQPNDAD